MNKKTLFLILFAVVLIFPFVACASQINDTVKALYDTAIAVGGSLAVIGWVIAGGMYLLAAGSPEKIGTAKKALVAAVIGTVLVILATSSATLIAFIKGTFGLK
jgi:hypothetical protein